MNFITKEEWSYLTKTVDTRELVIYWSKKWTAECRYYSVGSLSIIVRIWLLG